MSEMSKPLNLTPELLGLSNIIIMEVKEARDGSIHVMVKSNQSETLCRHCKSPTEPYGYGRSLT